MLLISCWYLIAENREGKLEEPFFKIGKYWYDDPETRTLDYH